MKRLAVVFGMILFGVGLTGCRQSTPVTQDEGLNPTMAAAEERVNQFLADNNISLPAGVSRANLRDVSNSGGTGVATRQITNGTTTITILADLPEPGNARYMGWLLDVNGTAVPLGQLIPEKGGYVVEQSTASDWSVYTTVVVSQEIGTVTQPTDRVLEGAF